MQEAPATDVNALMTHLFRREAGKMVAVLTRVFGVHHMELAEDMVQETLLQACRVWPFKGVPQNPAAWLYTVAKNKIIDQIRKEKNQQALANDIGYLLQSAYSAPATLDRLFEEKKIRDDQLRMIFTCCHPALAPEAQVALTLKTLCGFSVNEIANAFISNAETIQKRLYRARQKIKEEQIAFEVPQGRLLQQRLDMVLKVIYLLFNEGYKTSSSNQLIRYELCEEAIRLAGLIADHPQVNNPRVQALLALMCFHAARFPSRLDADGNILLLKEQDRSLWNRQLIAEGLRYLEQSASGEELSEYHLEAAIASEYSLAPSYAQTNWRNILNMYSALYGLNASPIVALNRAIVINELQGPETAIAAIESIPGIESLKNYYLLHATLGELYRQSGQTEKAVHCLQEALKFTEAEAEKKLIQHRLDALKESC